MKTYNGEPQNVTDQRLALQLNSAIRFYMSGLKREEVISATQKALKNTRKMHNTEEQFLYAKRVSLSAVNTIYDFFELAHAETH